MRVVVTFTKVKLSMAKHSHGPAVDEPSIHSHNPGNSLTLRLRTPDEEAMPIRITTLITKLGMSVNNLSNFCLVGSSSEFDVTVNLTCTEDSQKLTNALTAIPGVEIRNLSDQTFKAHLGGQISIIPRRPIINADDLSLIYTPGVAEICTAIQKDPSKAYNLTGKGNSILVVTDGSRILGLGNIGPLAGYPVMAGKAALFARFGGVNAVPMPLDTQDADEIIQACIWMAPGYGGINLEDIESPKCWYIEEQLKKRLNIPVFHDDQHGTAVVVLAAALNAARFVGKKLKDMKIVLSGVGAAGMACGNLLLKGGARNLIGFKKEGAIYKGRTDMNPQEVSLASRSNPERFTGSLKDAMRGADMFVGLSAAGVIEGSDIKRMGKDPIVFALANPVPEVDPFEASKWARVVATGSSKFPNQTNNALVFPGIFKGALEARVSDITPAMQLEAARSLARVLKPSVLRSHKIIPDVFDQRAHDAVAAAVLRVAHRTGQARRDQKVR